MSLEELTALVNDPLPKALNILDFNNETSVRVSDEKVRGSCPYVPRKRPPRQTAFKR